MMARIEAIRGRAGSALLARPPHHEVACVMISRPVFFDRDDWIADHADWHPRIQGGKTIDVSRGDGQRILAECLERTARLRPEAEPLADELHRCETPQTVQPRLGQGTFRIAVTSAYGACAALGLALAARARGRARAPLRGRRRARARQRTAAPRRHPLPLRRRLRHCHAPLPLPREPRPRRRLPRAAASTSASPAAPLPCRALPSTSPTPSCSTGTRPRCSGGEDQPAVAAVLNVHPGGLARGRPFRETQAR